MTWRKYIQTKGMRETPFVVSVVNDGKLSLGDFYSIPCKGCNLDQDSWQLTPPVRQIIIKISSSPQ